MSAKAVSEYTGKELLYRHLTHVEGLATPHAVKLDETSNFATATQNCEWLKKEGVCYFNCHLRCMKTTDFKIDLRSHFRFRMYNILTHLLYSNNISKS